MVLSGAPVVMETIDCDQLFVTSCTGGIVSVPGKQSHARYRGIPASEQCGELPTGCGEHAADQRLSAV